MVSSPTQMLKRWFFLDRRYENMVATMVRWFAFIFWLTWVLMAAWVVIAQGDGGLAIIYMVSAFVFMVLFRIIFRSVARANGWEPLDPEEER